MASKSIISIDMGSSKTKLAVGIFRNGSVYLEKAFVLDTPQGSLKDGKLILSDGKAEALKQSIIQALSAQKINCKDAVFTIQSTSLIRRELEIPHVKSSELKSMISYEIEQYLPIDLNEYITEYKISEVKSNNTLKVLIAALPKEIVEDYLSLLSSTKLEPKALDINSNAVCKLFSYKQQINNTSYKLETTAAFIDLGSSNIGISIVSKGLYQFSRLIPTGGNGLTKAISEAFGISEHEAENKKISEADLSKTDSTALNNVIIKVISQWAEDIMKVFQFYKTRNQNNNIDEIYLYGGTSNLRGIAEYLEKAMNIPTMQIRSLSSVVLQKSADSIDLEYFLNSIGAIIRK